MPQVLNLDAALTDDSWGLARIIRRDAPWNVDRIVLPFSSYFRSVRDGSGVDVYHIDTGVRASHDEFGGRAELIYEHVSVGAGDESGHGTVTASCAVGETTGIARGSSLFSLKSHRGSALGDFASPSAVNACVSEILSHYASRSGLNRPAVCNLSVAFTTEATAIADLIDAGIVCVASASNEGIELGVGGNIYPAQTTDVICVGGAGMADIPQYFSRDDGSQSVTNYGSVVDILAPAQFGRAAGIASDAAYLRSSISTSGAAGYVSGVVACMLQGKSRLTTRTQVQAVKAKLLANATTGRFRAQAQFGIGTLPDRILYLDPDITDETIDGVT